jgi:hypothetical protein
MYDFKMPSKLAQRGQPLPEMPEGVGMPMPAMPSMQPDQQQGVQSLMANYNTPQAAQQTPSFGFYGTSAPSLPYGFGMPAGSPQNTQNSGIGGGQSVMGPSFFTL